MTKLKLAVVGAGHLGRIHARLLAEMPDVDLIGVADPLSTARDKTAADCRTTAVADHRQLVGRVDGAVIAVPTRHHHAVALDFLRQGTPLLVEKPLATDLAEADDLVHAARHAGVVLQVGHIERFNPAFQAAAGHMSHPRYVEAVRASGFTGRSTDIGVVHDLMIHDIDLLLALVDAPVKSVSALGLAVLGRREDVAQARVEFEDGCVANLSASRLSFASAPKRQMQAWCEGGFTVVDFAARTANVVRPSESVAHRQFDYNNLPKADKTDFQQQLFSEVLRVEPLMVESRNALADELRDFCDSIRGLHSPRVSGAQGRDAIALAETILDSIDHHRWHGRSGGPMGPLATPTPPILRGPHWDPAPQTRPARREAG